jgi:DNA-binding HxlR family transcriptional regulator
MGWIGVERDAARRAEVPGQVVSFAYHLTRRNHEGSDVETQEGNFKCPGSLDDTVPKTSMTTSASARPRDYDAAPVRDVLERIGDKWSVIVICRLDAEPIRFNELRRRTDGITQRMLSVTLRRLERDGLVSRTVFPTVPPQVEYGLTDRGRSLHEVLRRLVEWTDTHLPGVLESRAQYDAR